MNTTRPSLADLVAEANNAMRTGEAHASYALEGEELDISALQKAAMAGHEASAAALKYLSEAKEMTFRDAFARSAYLRGKIAQLAGQQCPEPEEVLGTLFSAQGKKMFVRGPDGKPVEQPAIPLFRSTTDRNEVRRCVGRNAIKLPDAFRREKGTPREHMEGARFRFLIPATTADRECYEELAGLLKRMPEVLAHHFEEYESQDVRQCCWLVLNLVSGTRGFNPGFAKKIFEETEGGFEEKEGNRAYLRFDLSDHEVLVLDDTPVNRRIVKRLKIFAEVATTLLSRGK